MEQNPVLFATSLSENIKFGKFDVKFEEVNQVLKKVNAEDFAAKLDKYVGGSQLLTTQKQKLCVARTLVKNPKVYFQTFLINKKNFIFLYYSQLIINGNMDNLDIIVR